MEYITRNPESAYVYHMAARRKSAISRFFQWAAKEDAEHHIGWVGATVTSMTAVFFPLTMAAILINGGAFGLIIVAMASLALVVITNLAALSTKYTIPFFFLGVLTNIAVVVASFIIK